MRGSVREFLTIWGGLIALFLIVEHYTGFSRDVGAIGGSLVGVSKTLQGR